MSQASSNVTLSAAAALSEPTPGSLPTTYVESDPAQRSDAMIAHLCGLFGILGTGVFYVVKKKDAKPFVLDQAKEAFNFHLLVFAAAIALSVAGAIAGFILGLLALVFSLANMTLLVGAIVLSVMNAMKASKGNVARYPARISVLK